MTEPETCLRASERLSKVVSVSEAVRMLSDWDQICHQWFINPSTFSASSPPPPHTPQPCPVLRKSHGLITPPLLGYHTRCTSLRRQTSPESSSARCSTVCRLTCTPIQTYLVSRLSAIHRFRDNRYPVLPMYERAPQFRLSQEERGQMGTRGLCYDLVCVPDHIHRN